MASQLPVDAMAPIAADTVDSAAFAPAAARSRPVAAVESVAMKASVALRHTGLTSGHVAGELGCCGQRRGPSYSGHRLCTNSAARGASHAPSFAVCANEASGAIDASSAACGGGGVGRPRRFERWRGARGIKCEGGKAGLDGV